MEYIDELIMENIDIYLEKHPEELEEINSIFRKWGFEPNKWAIYLISREIYQIRIGKYDYYFDNYEFLELARLILFLNQSAGNSVTFNSTIKGQLLKAKLESKQTIKMLNLWANSRLNEMMGTWRYSDIVEKKKGYEFQEGRKDDFYTEPFTENELKQIIDFEEKKISLSLPEEKLHNYMLLKMNQEFLNKKRKGVKLQENSIFYIILLFMWVI
jgi:hypothetical protein